ncbi:MAG: hypothetical protein MK008_04735 [Bdellovibrionales bacterium]|nr:hypothetical protein [Bdellovibrionales bacterium]
MMFIKNVFYILILSLFTLSTYAQEKHPRVAELEDKIKNEAVSFFKTRFPELPFSVNVDIDPLRRQTNNYLETRGETLPYYALDQEEIIDEWDDPAVSLYSLRNRVKSIALSVKMPSTISDKEIVDIKESLTKNLRLLPARDKIDIVKEKWTINPFMNSLVLLSLSILFIFLTGIFLIIKLSMKSLNKSISEISNNSAGAPASGSMDSSSIGKPIENKNTKSEDFKFNDPIRTKEISHALVDEIVQSKSYLNLDNFLYLQDLVEKDIGTLGSLLTLFPIDVQKQWLAYSKDEKWLDGFDHPGEVTHETLKTLEHMCRVRSDQANPEWDMLLIQIWRLDDQVDKVLKNISQEEAFAILFSLPKSLSVPIARRLFPGSWASIIDESFKPVRIENTRVEEILALSLEHQPKVTYNDFKVYQKEKELLNYIAYADVVEEREIYEASPDTSLIKKKRPPFYKLFSLPEESIEAIYKTFSINEWSLALFDAPRDWREKIEALFNEKEKFLYFNNLKKLDQNRPDKSVVGNIRSKIGYEVFMHESVNLNNLSDSENIHDAA